MIKRTIFLLSIAFITVCCKQNEIANKDNQQSDLTETSATNSKRQKEIEDTKYFIENEYSNNIIDENGIKQNYKVEKTNLSKELKYDSKDVACATSKYRIYSYTSIIRYKLSINGELYGEYDFPSYQIECFLDGSMNYGRNILYSPELNSEEEKKQFISSLTGQNFGCGEETNNRLIQSCVESLQACGMLTK
jgi:hypothetical protein